MPGRFESLEVFLAQCRAEAVEEIVCLVSDEEIEEKSPDYGSAVKESRWPLAMTRFPIPDYGIPDDISGLVACVREVVEKLRRGRKMVVHCAAGCGRTGVFAVLVLHIAGMNLAAAKGAVQTAGSKPDTHEQDALLEKIADSLDSLKPCFMGVDVGAAKKGFHMVCINSHRKIISSVACKSVQELRGHVNKSSPKVIAIDCPRAWATKPGGREAERIMCANNISIFFTPIQQKCNRDIYNWMGNGMPLFEELKSENQSIIEVYPYSIAVRLSGNRRPHLLSKIIWRRNVLSNFGIWGLNLRNIDFVDAALAASTSLLAHQNKTEKWGNDDEGFIVLPSVA